jgi:sialate O-acetylesterase
MWALDDVYGRKITRGGPVFEKIEVKGDKIILTFRDAGSGLKIKDGDRLDEFAIAGADKKWFWADAKIAGKNKIEVSSAKVLSPAAVRYAFNNNPKHPNLTNETGIPAGPFRTDNWADPTEGKW